MSLLEALLLGLIQGLSEFLPISSTAHLTLAGRALGLIDPAEPHRWTAFVAVIQLGTLVAVLVYFGRDIVSIVKGFFKGLGGKATTDEEKIAARTGWLIIVGTIPIVVIGLAFKKQIEGVFTKDLLVIGSSLVVLALILELAERLAKFNRPIESATMKDAVGIGMAQAMALIPGSSRSGTTITAGLFAGFTREAAARFSFLLSIPSVAAAGLLEMKDAIPDLSSSSELLPLVVATVVAGISGYLSIAFLLRYLRTRTTRLFVVYRLLLGGAILLGIAMKWIDR